MIDFLNRDSIKRHLKEINQAIDKNSSVIVTGMVTRISGMKIEASGLSVPIGTLCQVMGSDKISMNAEVIGFSDSSTFLMASEDIVGIRQGAPVIPLSTSYSAKVGMMLLGRVIDATGCPIDAKGNIDSDEYYSLIAKPINPLKRRRINESLDVGIRVINGLLTVGKGQRLGIFAGSGVGKSVLLGMMTRYTSADIVVVGLIGERGREVKEFIEESLGEIGLKKSVVVASPADTSPIMRVNGAALATTIAEYYRDKGFDVLLIIDSLTRFAQAQREIGLSVGELPTTKGFTPSVFGKLSQLVERSGNGTGEQGSITAFYTVLMEGDDHNDPVADHARSILDGHIFLSRHLADAGHYPAIDVEKSISRVMPAIVNEKQMELVSRFKKFYSAYIKNRDLINIGMYQRGADTIVDQAIFYKDKYDVFLKQGTNECSCMDDSVKKLKEIFDKE